MKYTYSVNPFGSWDTIIGREASLGIIAAVCLLLAIAGGLVLFFAFLTKKNENRFSGFGGWLYEFLNFKAMFAEALLKALYLISAIYLTLSALGTLFFVRGGSIGPRLLVFLLTVVVGNIVLRLVYEFLLVLLVICRNTTEINRKLGKSEEPPAPAAPALKQAEPERPQEIGVVFCRNCGQKFSSNEPACPHCGAKKL